MGKKQLVVSTVLMCCVILAFSGCKTKKASIGSGNGNGPEIPRVEPGTDIAGGQQLSAGPRPDAFEKGARVADAFETVLFEFDSAQVNPGEQSKIDAVAGFLKNNLDAVAILEGNCDDRGSAEYNMSLGERRALAVRAALISAGIDAARLQTRSFGEEKPIDPGQNEEAWSKNRRVEFCVLR